MANKPALKTVPWSAVKLRFWLIVLLAVVAGLIAYPKPANWLIAKGNDAFGFHLPAIKDTFTLGLDLEGGTSLEYEADMTNVPVDQRDSELSGVRDLIERRVNALGVSEPNVTTAKTGDSYRVSVELAGIKDVNQAINTIGQTPILEFKEQATTTPATSLTADQQKQLDQLNSLAAGLAQTALNEAVKNPAGFDASATAATTTQGVPVTGANLGFVQSDSADDAAILQAAEGAPTGTVIPHLVETDTGYTIVHVDAESTSGTEIRTSQILIQYIGATGATSSTTRGKAQALALAQTISKEATAQNFASLAKQYSDDPTVKSNQGDTGWFGKGVMVQQYEDAAYGMKVNDISQPVESPFGYHVILKTGERPQQNPSVTVETFHKTTADDLLNPNNSGWVETQLGGKQLKSATLNFDQRTGQPEISLQFDAEGTKLFADMTKRDVGKQIGIFLDGNLVVSPVVNEEIPNGQAVITGAYTVTQAKTTAEQLQQGALPVPIHLISENTVGPTLGSDQLTKSLMAGLIGFALVALFMILIYRLPGAFAILALLLYAALSFAIFKIVPITLTLAGIAGFILSLGIAVDANVLVFERLKEELAEGKAIALGLEESFRRAWPSIRDGHVTVLISCAVLYWFSSSVIKGFALTLAIGTIISLFTAVVTCRTMLRFAAGTRLSKNNWLFLKKTPKTE